MAVLGALNPIILGSVGRRRGLSVVTGTIEEIGTLVLVKISTERRGTAGLLTFLAEAPSSSLLGGVLKGDTLF